MKNHINIYNNLIKLTRDKKLYLNTGSTETFSLRLIFFLIHFALFLRNYKKDNSKKILQEIYDFTFRQLELSIREIGYGDQSINKKMKDYLNLFHDMIDKFHFWEDFSNDKKLNIINNYVSSTKNPSILLNYFENFLDSLKKNTLNSYIKSVIRS